MRAAGEPAAALLLYKLVFTVDAPISWLRQAGEYLWRRRGAGRGAQRSLVVLRGVGGFLQRGLREFWRA